MYKLAEAPCRLKFCAQRHPGQQKREGHRISLSWYAECGSVQVVFTLCVQMDHSGVNKIFDQCMHVTKGFLACLFVNTLSKINIYLSTRRELI